MCLLSSWTRTRTRPYASNILVVFFCYFSVFVPCGRKLAFRQLSARSKQKEEKERKRNIVEQNVTTVGRGTTANVIKERIV